jgi:hypothetical protein
MSLFGIDNCFIHLYSKVGFPEDRDFKLAVLYCGVTNRSNQKRYGTDKPATQLGWTLKAIKALSGFIQKYDIERALNWNIVPEFKQWLRGCKLITCSRDKYSDKDGFGCSYRTGRGLHVRRTYTQNSDEIVVAINFDKLACQKEKCLWLVHTERVSAWIYHPFPIHHHTVI